MYADKMTGSMQRAIGETDRRREIQESYNQGAWYYAAVGQEEGY